jgi:hypothetical protein
VILSPRFLGGAGHARAIPQASPGDDRPAIPSIRIDAHPFRIKFKRLIPRVPYHNDTLYDDDDDDDDDDTSHI